MFEIISVTFAASRSTFAGLTALALVAGCSTVQNLFVGDKVDYQSSGSARATGVEVPPDLTQLARTSRYQHQDGASSKGSAASTRGSIAPVSALSVGTFRLERLGRERWLSTSLAPEVLYAQVRAFWEESGFTLVKDHAALGTLETDWSENRAKRPKDAFRNAIGKLRDSLLSTGELDKFLTRIERTPTGSDVYISHRGMQEVYVGASRDDTVWRQRQPEPRLEDVLYSQLMVRLGATEEDARAIVAAGDTPAGLARARLLDSRPTPTLLVDDGFDRAWRRVGIALDRTGFMIEARDRSEGLYFVRYAEPAHAGRQQAGLLARLFSFGGKDGQVSHFASYQVKVEVEGDASTAVLLDSRGRSENGEAARRILGLLLDDLK